MDSPFTSHVQALSPLDGNAIDGSRRPVSRSTARRLERPEFPVTTTYIHPSTKRLTRRQEERGAEMFEADKSERQVAKALGVSASTAHRLRLRLAGTPSRKEGLAARALKEGKGWSVQEVEAATVPVSAVGDLEARRAKLARELEELDALLYEAHHKELADALDALSMVSPHWPPLAALWGRVAGELGELSRTL